MRLLQVAARRAGGEKREEELAHERGAAQNTGFGSQIRSYVLHPYQLVKDLRTSHETGNTRPYSMAISTTSSAQYFCPGRTEKPV